MLDLQGLAELGKNWSTHFCQTSVKVLRLEVDFVLPLSQEEEEEQQQQPPPNISFVAGPILTKL